MINLTLRTEFSFKKTFGHIDKIIEGNPIAIGIADVNSTFGHVPLEKLCKKNNIKSIFGVRLGVVKSVAEKVRTEGWQYIFIAKNLNGLRGIYNLVKIAYDNFYYIPRVGLIDVWKLSDDIFVISDNFEIAERIDYIGLSPSTNPKVLDFDLPRVAINNNYFSRPQDKKLYEILSGNRGRELHTYPQHILTEDEFMWLWNDKTAVENTYAIAKQCNVEIEKASMVKYHGDKNLRDLCLEGAQKRGIDLSNKVYSDRMERELSLIDKKNFADYFLITSEMIIKAKKTMLVGPSRGSSAGSLVCYLTYITEIDPIEYGLLFERFIDINRSDLPDVDIDFPDKKRDKVIKELVKTNGRDNVRRIANINRLKPKSAIGEFADALGIPSYETDTVKDAIIERSGGDARFAMRILDTFESTEAGKNFINKYPNMKLVENMENHASYIGVHAAGVIVANNPLHWYGGIDTRSDIVMMDKKGAEYLGLLKIDCLGLRTLSVLEDCAELIGMDNKEYYNLPLDDELTFKIFNNMRLSGIFQFEGYALQAITRQMGVHNFNDIVAITSLARPGPLHSGGTNTFVARRIGKESIEYMSDDDSIIKNTKETLGTIVYQEQLMNIGRDYGGLSWEDVSNIRKATSKSLGEEYLNKYKDKFIEGAVKKGFDSNEATKVWNNMVTFGSWAFNKSHAVAYGLISYFTAYMKAHYPLEFTVACLNNTKDDPSAVKILRDSVENDGLEYIPVDPILSEINWTVKNGKMIGGFVNIHGIGIKKAQGIIKRRKSGKEQTPSISKKLASPETPFDILSPCKYHWGDIYNNPREYGLDIAPINITEIQGDGSYLFIGCLVDRNLRDLNEYQSVVKRGGKIIKDHTLFLNLTLEDDSDSIICTIDRYSYEEKGKIIAESGKINSDWFLVKGVIKGGWRKVNIKEIINLNNHIGLKGVNNAVN